MLWPTVISFILLLSQRTGATGLGGIGLEESGLGVVSLRETGLAVTGLDGARGSSSLESIVEDIKPLQDSKLIEMGSNLNLRSLESLLKKRRLLAGTDDQIAEYYREALAIMTACPALRNFEEAVQRALDIRFRIETFRLEAFGIETVELERLKIVEGLSTEFSGRNEANHGP
ncbi:hypothetical protein PSACC_01061 [Paramicrosporidium saccamoebae]|uniref:Uncharacterized protein n=1 Tax=Paramicrosporidium saccamoebae TaxID=1246581 RepID=A0A2H9TN46_9FUNG|nr:hypothetical protein PSACC_01061 [Paramicrosporidium saccamoebae]